MGYFDLSGSQASPPPPQKWNIAKKKKLIAFQKILSKKKIWYNFFFSFWTLSFFLGQKTKIFIIEDRALIFGTSR